VARIDAMSGWRCANSNSVSRLIVAACLVSPPAVWCRSVGKITVVTSNMSGHAAAPLAADATPLQRELRQTVPFSSPAVEAVLGIQRTAEASTRHFSAILKPFGITQTQYNVLRILRGAGEKGLPTLEISQRMVTSDPDMPRLVDRLDKLGWVTRTRCENDRRVVWCSVTSAGLDMLAKTDALAESAPVEQLAVLTPDEQRLLVSLLDRVRAAITAATR
jgi:MarR family transcriptional regulator, organic hydroperoxide resistance regulator